MADGLLYYPHIRVPQNPWCVRTLLYWDKIGTLMPSHARRESTPFMRELIAAEMLEAVNLEGFWDKVSMRHELIQFTDNFFQAVDFDEAKKRLETDPTDVIRVSLEKMDYGSFEELVRILGVANISNYSWFHLEKQIGLQYLTGIATVVSRCHPFDYVPGTDSINAITTLAPKQDTSYEQTNPIDAFRATILERVFPVPEDNVSLAQLHLFRNKYGEGLRRFRGKIEQTAIHASTFGSEWLAHELDSLSDEIDEIAVRMAEQKWGRVMRRGICTMTIPALSAFAAFADHSPYSGGATLLTVAAAAYNVVRSRESAKKDVNREALAYAAFVQTKLGSAN